MRIRWIVAALVLSAVAVPVAFLQPYHRGASCASYAYVVASREAVRAITMEGTRHDLYRRCMAEAR